MIFTPIPTGHANSHPRLANRTRQAPFLPDSAEAGCFLAIQP